MREEVLAVVAIEREAMRARAHGVDEERGGPVEDVARGELIAHRPERGGRRGGAAAGGADREDRPHRAAHVEVRRAVHRIARHHDRARPRPLRHLDRLGRLLRDVGGARVRAAQRARHRLVRPDVQRLLLVAGEVLAAGGAGLAAQGGEGQLARDVARHGGDGEDDRDHLRRVLGRGALLLRKVLGECSRSDAMRGRRRSQRGHDSPRDERETRARVRRHSPLVQAAAAA